MQRFVVPRLDENAKDAALASKLKERDSGMICFERISSSSDKDNSQFWQFLVLLIGCDGISTSAFSPLPAVCFSSINLGPLVVAFADSAPHGPPPVDCPSLEIYRIASKKIDEIG